MFRVRAKADRARTLLRILAAERADSKELAIRSLRRELELEMRDIVEQVNRFDDFARVYNPLLRDLESLLAEMGRYD